MPSTISCHFLWSSAIHSAHSVGCPPLGVSPGVSQSTSSSLALGAPVKAWRVILLGGLHRFCSVHLHLLLLVSPSAGDWLVLCLSSVLPIVSGQWIWEILCRQVFLSMVVCVILRVSEPCRADFTIELKKRILVWVVIWWDIQIFLRVMNAHRTFPIRVFTSVSVPPCWLMTLPM